MIIFFFVYKIDHGSQGGWFAWSRRPRYEYQTIGNAGDRLHRLGKHKLSNGPDFGGNKAEGRPISI